jgi:hypothetical protein
MTGLERLPGLGQVLAMKFAVIVMTELRVIVVPGNHPKTGQRADGTARRR